MFFVCIGLVYEEGRVVGRMDGLYEWACVELSDGWEACFDKGTRGYSGN